jgi:hypothetical protein
MRLVEKKGFNNNMQAASPQTLPQILQFFFPVVVD